MSETLNVNVLVAAKEEYTKQLINTLQPYVYEIIKNIYTDSQKHNIRLPVSYSNFQIELKTVPNWAGFKLEECLNKINVKLPYLMDLITAIFVSHVKILACVRLKSDNKSIKIKVPNLNTFLHKVVINICENIYYNPTVIEEEKDKIFSIINNSIVETIANQIPIEYILNEYLSGVFDDDEQENIIEPEHFDIDNDNDNDDDVDDNESDVGEPQLKNIPIVPIERPVDRKVSPGSLQDGVTQFEDLKDKDKNNPQSFKIDKREDIVDDDSEISEDDQEDDQEDDLEDPLEDKKIEPNEPTLF